MKSIGARWSFRIVVALATTCVALAATAADERPAATPRGRSASFAVDIAEAPMEAALEAFAAQTGLQVVYASAGIAHGLRAPRVAGTYAAEEILARLLANAGLRYAFVNDNTVMLREARAPESAPPPPAAASPHVPVPRAHGEAGAATGEGAVDRMLETVTVTGTNLANIDPASPLLIIDAETIERRGYSSIEDVLRSLPQNVNSVTTASAALGEVEFGENSLARSSIGHSSVNLRGLGSRSTLILVDGRRRAGSAQDEGGYTDISSIPLSQIERIEILTDGASAIYGADAVAGVVNIVLKKSFTGTTVDVRREISSTGGDASRASAARTFAWQDGFLTAILGYQETQPANFFERLHRGPQGRGDFTDLGGINARLQGIGTPGVVYEAPDQSPLGFAGNPIGVIPGGQTGVALAPDQLLPFVPGVALPSTYDLLRTGPEVKSKTLRLSGRQDLGTDLSFNYGFGYAQQQNTEVWQPTLFGFNFLGSQRYTYVPADNPYNRFGRGVFVGYSYEREFAGMRFSEDQQQNNLDFNAGLSGNLPFWPRWHFETNYTRTSERGTSDYVADSTGAYGPEGIARIQSVLEGLNVFGDGSDAAIVAANRALLQTLVERTVGRFSSQQDTFDALTRGELFALPGGNAQIALGGQYRIEKYSTFTDFGEDLAPLRSRSRRTVSAYFSELGLPLLKDLPLIEDLTLTFALRRENFDQGGISTLRYSPYVQGPDGEAIDLVQLGGFDVRALTGIAGMQNAAPARGARSYANTSPLARLAWWPIEDLRLRATWGKSFLTPLSRQQFGDLQVFALDTAYLELSGARLPPGVTSVLSVAGPNPNLKPQIATVRTFGFDYAPASIPALSLSATYNQTDFKNYIGAPLTGLSIADIFADTSRLPPEVLRLGANGVLLWDMREINFLGRSSSSVDVNASYGFANRLGDWRVDLNATRTLRLELRTLPSLPQTTLSDSEYGPSKWGADLALNWSRGDFFAVAGGHYTGPHRVLDPYSDIPEEVSGIPTNPNPRRRAGSYITFDLHLGYRPQTPDGWRHGLTAQIGVKNLLDRPFPFVDNLYGFASNRVDVRGRVVYLNLKKEF